MTAGGFVSIMLAMMALLLDIGRPERFWKSFVFWNTHSLLWEVTMCVGLYFTVLLLEVMPSGAKIWRYRYQMFGVRQPTLTIGNYIAVSLIADYRRRFAQASGVVHRRLARAATSRARSG